MLAVQPVWLLNACILVGWFNRSATEELTVLPIPKPPGPHQDGHAIQITTNR